MYYHSVYYCLFGISDMHCPLCVSDGSWLATDCRSVMLCCCRGCLVGHVQHKWCAFVGKTHIKIVESMFIVTYCPPTHMHAHIRCVSAHLAEIHWMWQYLCCFIMSFEHIDDILLKCFYHNILHVILIIYSVFSKVCLIFTFLSL